MVTAGPKISSQHRLSIRAVELGLMRPHTEKSHWIRRCAEIRETAELAEAIGEEALAKLPH